MHGSSDGLRRLHNGGDIRYDHVGRYEPPAGSKSTVSDERDPGEALWQCWRGEAAEVVSRGVLATIVVAAGGGGGLLLLDADDLPTVWPTHSNGSHKGDGEVDESN